MQESRREQVALSINDQLKHLSKEIAVASENLKPVATQCSRSDPQRAELMQHQELIYKNMVMAQKRYNALLYAQKQLNDDTFGLCNECDEVIALERLLLMPESTYCVDCLNKRD